MFLFGYGNTSKDIRNEESSELDNSCDTNNVAFLSKCIHKNEYVSYYVTDARDLVPEVNNASFQRNVDQDHVNKLTEAIKYSNHCVGTFKAVYCNNVLELIDGQHRILALQNIMKEDALFNPELFLEVYPITDNTSKREWFKRANNVKNFNEEDLPNNIDDIVDEVIVQLRLVFHENIKISKVTGGKLYRPNMNEKELTQKLKAYITKNNHKYPLIISNKIIQLNKEYGLKSRKDFDCSKTMYDKAKKSGCYIGLVKDMTWINEL
jgi:hypothetical protein